MFNTYTVYIKNLKTQEIMEYQMTKAQYRQKMQSLNAKETIRVHPLNGWAVYDTPDYDVSIDIA